MHAAFLGLTIKIAKHTTHFFQAATFTSNAPPIFNHASYFFDAPFFGINSRFYDLVRHKECSVITSFRPKSLTRQVACDNLNSVKGTMTLQVPRAMCAEALCRSRIFLNSSKPAWKPWPTQGSLVCIW